MITLTFIGYGNVAQHLIQAFLNNSEIKVQQVFLRDASKAIYPATDFEFISDWSQLIPADIFIVAVSDDYIAEVSTQLPLKNQLVVHTSGSVGLDTASDQNRRGVFYPLQTFTKGKKVDFKEIPICIETEFSSDLDVLKKIAKAISNKTHIINSQQRKALHVAAVFINNFTNHMYQLGSEICQENQIPFALLEPLIAETAAKVTRISPFEAQTGPAKRNDQKTIDAHIDFLKSNTNQQSIYKLLTQSIQENGKKL